MGEQVERMSPFRLLLNEISYELTEQNLQSLIHIYGVPGGVKKQINDGLALFGYMITQDYISRDKIGNLRKLIRQLRPRRKDLVRLVDNYIKKEKLVISGSLEQSHENKRPVTIDDETTTSCNIDCACFDLNLNCLCRRVPYTPIILVLLVAIIVTGVLWYADVPKISESIRSNSDLNNAGMYILMAEILTLLFVTGFRVRRSLVSCLACYKSSYTVLANPDDQGPSRQITSASDIRLQSQRRASRPYKTSESESAVFSETSGERSSLSTFGTFQPMDEHPDSSGPEH
ncbi:FAS-associated death domain [Paramuricea clavata]|uniref:FAS-associated death domain n=1 Tax=Paramuricea clavata TaxID=317549 RepID=A0A6S7FRV3_PARCT|nr:FAS-associated death domain [Paramuricea clavata]